MFRILRKAIEISRKEKQEKADADERLLIAKHFNNRYTFRKEWVEGKERLPGTGMFGFTPRGGYAWMCPECNKIHLPESSSSFTGLQYPRCCKYPQGHRLDYGIKTS